MTFSTKRLILGLLALGTMLVMTTAASAQATLDSGPMPITLNATLTESLTLTLSGNAVNFTLAPGSNTNAGSTNITANTSWVLAAGRTVNVYAYFDTSVALTDGTNPIPNTAFSISNNGGAYATLTNATPWTAFGYRLENVAISTANGNLSGSTSDQMAFNINLSTGTLPSLPAGVYTGTLNIRAQATP